MQDFWFGVENLEYCVQGWIMVSDGLTCPPGKGFQIVARLVTNVVLRAVHNIYRPYGV